jgi:hypothetical protein
MRATAVAASLVALGLACAKAPEMRPIPVPVLAAPAMVTITGALDIVVGDPTGVGAEQVRASVVEADGKRTALVMVRRQLDDLGAAARQPGTRVRVTGEPATLNGAPAIRVTNIMLVTP